MTSFARKIKRKKHLADRKQFMKHFKSSMKKFRSQVKCSRCDHQPAPGESIDDWHIDQESDNIDLVCTKCIGQPMQAPEKENV